MTKVVNLAITLILLAYSDHHPTIVLPECTCLLGSVGRCVLCRNCSEQLITVKLHLGFSEIAKWDFCMGASYIMWFENGFTLLSVAAVLPLGDTF